MIAGALDHGVGHLGVEIERDGDRHVGRDLADAIQQLAFAVVVMLGDHGAVQGEQHGVAALLHLVDDGRRHLLIGGLGHQARRMSRCRHRHGELRTRLARHLDEAAERGVGAFGFLDGRRAGQCAGAGKRLDGGRERREGIGLVHHHRHDELLRHQSPPFCQVLEQSIELPEKPALQSFASTANQLRANSCALQKGNTQIGTRNWLNL